MRQVTTRLAEMDTRPPWSFLEMTNALAFMLIGMILVGPTFATLLLGDAPTPSALFIGWIVGALIAIVYVVLARLNRADSLSAMRLGPGPWPRPLYLLVGLAGSVSVHLFVAANAGLFVPPSALQVLRDAPPLAWALAGVFMLLIQPVADELVFRGVVLPWLRSRLGGWGGFLFTVGAYAFFHALLYPTALSGAAGFYYGQVYPLLMGIFFCGVRVLAQSTQASLLAHIGAGIFAFFSAPILLGG